MFRLFFVIVSLKTPLLLISFRKSLQKFPYHKKKALSQAAKLGGIAMLCQSRVLSGLSARKHKKNKTPIWENNSPFQSNKTAIYFTKTAFFFERIKKSIFFLQIG